MSSPTERNDFHIHTDFIVSVLIKSAQTFYFRVYYGQIISRHHLHSFTNNVNALQTTEIVVKCLSNQRREGRCENLENKAKSINLKREEAKNYIYIYRPIGLYEEKYNEGIQCRI